MQQTRASGIRCADALFDEHLEPSAGGAAKRASLPTLLGATSSGKLATIARRRRRMAALGGTYDPSRGDESGGEDGGAERRGGSRFLSPMRRARSPSAHARHFDSLRGIEA